LSTPTIPGPKAKALVERDRRVVSPSYPRAYPFVMDHGRGSEIWDVDGNRFIDFAAGIAVCTTGHSHPRVVKAIQEQAEKFIHISSDFYNPKWIELSERLAKLAPFEEPAKVFLANSGTEAVEAAIKLARHHTGRQRFIGFYGAFHGRTMGSLAFTASKPVYRSGFLPLMNGVSHVPFPNTYRPVLRDNGADYGETVVRFIEDVVLRYSVPPEDCAAVLVEPIQGEGGYVVPPDSFFPALSKMWAIQHWGVEPDIVTSAKGLASGVPVGAMIARESVMDWPTGAHGNTFGGNPLACTAALTTLDLVESELMENAAEQGEYVMDAMAEIQTRHPSIGQVRGKGLMIGVEFVEDRESKKPAHDMREHIVDKAFRGGLVMLGCGESTIRIAPPLNIERELIDEGLRMFESAITEAEAEDLG
jgi:4-aminobutyrate aminotransferase